MLILVRCRSCGDEFRLPEERRGQRVQCRSCDELIRVPDSASPAAKPPVEPLPEADEAPPDRDEMVMPDERPAARPVDTGHTVKSSPRRPRREGSDSSAGTTAGLALVFGIILVGGVL